MAERSRPGEIRDAIMQVLRDAEGALTVAEVREKVSAALERDVAPSSIRSYLNINTPGLFERTGRGTYRLVDQ